MLERLARFIRGLNKTEIQIIKGNNEDIKGVMPWEDPQGERVIKLDNSKVNESP